MIRRLRVARCAWFGHRWTPWGGWEFEGFGFRHDRSCTRCPASELQRDGEEPVIYV